MDHHLVVDGILAAFSFLVALFIPLYGCRTNLPVAFYAMLGATIFVFIKWILLQSPLSVLYLDDCDGEF